MPRARTRGRRAFVAAFVAVALVGCSSGPEPSPSAAPDDPAPVVEPPGIGDATSEIPDAPEEAPETAPPEPELPEPPASRAALEERLADYVERALAADPDLELAVHVVDEHGREVVSHAPDEPILPASTLKTVTAAAVLTTLGPDTQLTTHLEATAGIDPEGRLDGDLVLRGVGDPTLTTDDYRRFIYPARPATPLDGLADALVEQGLQHLTGDVLGTAPGFGGALRPSGWRDNYLDALDGRLGSGLTTDGGLRTIVEYPEPEEDDEEADDEEADDEATDDEPDPEDRDEDDPDVETGPPEVRVELASDPAAHTVEVLLAELEDRGVQVDGTARVDEPETPIVARLATVVSPPLHDVLRFMVQRSDNHLADQLFLVAGRYRTGEGSWEGGDRALRQTLERLGVDHVGAHFADGSGLSRDDRVTARLLVELDRALTSSPRWGASWRSLQAVMGQSGTLTGRLAGTAASGRFYGKTGTLRDVTALSGQVVAADPEDPDAPRFHLAVLATAGPVGRTAARAMVDQTILALIAELDDCRLEALGDEAGPLGMRPRQVVC